MAWNCPLNVSCVSQIASLLLFIYLILDRTIASLHLFIVRLILGFLSTLIYHPSCGILILSTCWDARNHTWLCWNGNNSWINNKNHETALTNSFLLGNLSYNYGIIILIATIILVFMFNMFVRHNHEVQLNIFLF